MDKSKKIKLWKVFCEEHKFPGLWQHWFKEQSVAVGWSPPKWKLDKNSKNKNWNTARNALNDMKIGDYIVVALQNNRVGRLGEITNLEGINDNKWKPFVPISILYPLGEKGRRIEVRWELTSGPNNPDLIIQIPKDRKFNSRGTVNGVKAITIEELRKQMKDSRNWVSLLGKFNYEKALSDYISNYPSRLEEGLLRYPDSKIREHVFVDKTRSDVLLIDSKEVPVVVECKQNAPTSKDIDQLRRYIRLLKTELRKVKRGKVIRGILVHGGAQKISKELIKEAKKKPNVEIISYSLDVNFR